MFDIVSTTTFTAHADLRRLATHDCKLRPRVFIPRPTAHAGLTRQFTPNPVSHFSVVDKVYFALVFAWTVSLDSER